ncbi:MAG: nitroreductase family protein [Thermoplasmata archaeon]|nr:nitroreductase family protein [Thermoplasmata archaeon]
MELIESIRDRRSVRKMDTKPVPREMIEQILEAGKSAPSAGNLQARDFFVVTSKEMRERFVNAALGQKFIAIAPVAIVVCANLEKIESYGQRGKELYCIQDASASCQNMLLAIHGFGLGGCWIGAFDELAVSKIMGLPEHLRPVAIIPIGYPTESPKERRKRTDDVHWI